MLTRRRAALPARAFPFVLRQEWRCDGPDPRLGRLRALTLIKAGTKTPRHRPQPRYQHPLASRRTCKNAEPLGVHNHLWQLPV